MKAPSPSSSLTAPSSPVPSRSISTDDIGRNARRADPSGPPPSSPADSRQRRSSTGHIDYTFDFSNISDNDVPDDLLHASGLGLNSSSSSGEEEAIHTDMDNQGSSSYGLEGPAPNGLPRPSGEPFPPLTTRKVRRLKSIESPLVRSASEVLLARAHPQSIPPSPSSLASSQLPATVAPKPAVESPARVEHERRVRELAKATAYFRQKFGLREEKLITYCTCSLWRGFLYRRGWLYVSENYVCFYSQFLKENVVVAFKDITVIKKEAASMGLYNSIKLSTRAQEFYFSTFFGMDELFTLLEQLQQLAVERFLINTSMASLEEAKISSHKLNQRLLRVTAHHHHESSFNPSGSLDSMPALNVSSSSSSSPSPAADAVSRNKASASLSVSSSFPALSSSSSFSFSSPSPSSHSAATTTSFSFSDIQAALDAGSDPSVLSTIPGSVTPRSVTPRRVSTTGSTGPSSSSSSNSPEFEAVAEDVSGSASGEHSLLRRHQQHQHQHQQQLTVPLGGGGLDGGTPILSTTDLLAAKTRNEQLHGLFKLPPEEKLLLEFGAGLWWRERWFKGRCYVSDNFLCYSYTNPGYKDFISIVLGFSDFTSITKVGNKTIKIVTEESTVVVGVDKRDEMLVELQKQWGHVMAKNAILGADRRGTDRLAQQRGFMPWGDMVTSHDNFSPDYLEKQQDLFGKWEIFFQTYGSSPSMVKTPALAHRVRNGIPDELRGCVWQICSGSIYKAKAQPIYYRNLVESTSEKTSLATEEIDRDVHRSFPEHPLYQTARGLQRLKTVLATYSWRNPDIGYCQSMNFVSSLLLLYMSDEEAFWLMSTICEDIVPQYYHKAMVGSIVDQNIFEYLLEHFLPEMHKHVQSLNFAYALITLPWLLCLFIGYLPWELTLRVLDGLFFEGPNILFKVGLAIFALKEKEILEARSGEDIMRLLTGKLPLDVAETLKVAYLRFNELPMDKINEMRNSQKVNFLQDMQSTRRRSTVRQIRDDTAFTQEEAQEVFGRFKSVIPPDATYDTIDEERFGRIFFDYVPAWRHHQDLLPLLFKAFDRNRQDALDVVDFATGVCLLSKGTLRDKFQFCVRMFDPESTGELSRPQLEKAIGSFLALFNQTKSSRGVTFEKDKTQEIKLFVDKLFFKLPEREGRVAMPLAVEECIDHATLLSFFHLTSTTNTIMPSSGPEK